MSIAFAWSGLPDYAARCIRAVLDHACNPVTVIATPPNVPIEGMESSLGQMVHWIDEAQGATNWAALSMMPPKVLFVSGYKVPAFNALAAEVKRTGGKVVLMSDNNWTGSAKQKFIEPLRHRLYLRQRFDAVFLPGASGARLARVWGYPPEAIFTGLYGADPALFHGGLRLSERQKSFLFIGQFIERKNVLGLAEAFIQVENLLPNWTLSLCGSGPLAERIPTHPRIKVSSFVQPPQLAEKIRKNRCLVLPSLEEHWGLVAHEAALSGCALALAETVGAAEDLASAKNAILFPTGDIDAIANALLTIAGWDDASWKAAEAESRRLAADFGPNCFKDSVVSLVTKLTGSAP